MRIVAKQTITINAPAAKVWAALTTPETIKQYLFGTEVMTDWQVGSPIIYKGVWEGRAYEDKGIILKVIPEKLLESTYWSGMSGLPDLPENYKNVAYELTSDSDGTRLTVTQDNNVTEEEKNHSEQNWGVVLKSLKELLEK
jgi:uncharacterized protein YndB with AHSA1/START domain